MLKFASVMLTLKMCRSFESLMIVVHVVHALKQVNNGSLDYVVSSACGINKAFIQTGSAKSKNI